MALAAGGGSPRARTPLPSREVNATAGFPLFNAIVQRPPVVPATFPRQHSQLATTGSAALGRTDSQIDRALVSQGRAIDPFTIAYHTPSPAAARARTASLPVFQALSFAPLTGGQRLTAPTFTDAGNWFTPTATAPQIATDPLSGVAARFVPNFQNIPQAAATNFQALGGQAHQAATQPSIMEGANTAMALMDYYGEGRVAAAREGEIARGMGRSGVALALEDSVQKETDLHKQNIFQGYVRAQAELNQEVEIANAQMRNAWAGLVDQSRQFQATLNQDRELANMQARIQMTGMQSEFALGLADIARRREELNATLQQTQQQMLRSASEFDRNFTWAAQLDRFNSQLQTAAHNEGVRQFNIDAGLRRTSLDAEQQAERFRQALEGQRLGLDQARFGLEERAFDWERQLAQAQPQAGGGRRPASLSEALTAWETLQIDHPDFIAMTPEQRGQELDRLLALQGLQR